LEEKARIDAFARFGHQTMTAEPYASAKTVCWIVDNGS
jgi:hypothetical protein